MGNYNSRVVKEMEEKAKRFFSESSLDEKEVQRCSKQLHEMRLNYNNNYRQYFKDEDIPYVE